MKRLRCAWLLLCACAGCAGAVQPPPPPAGLDARAGFEQRLGARLPMDARFTDASGRSARLGEWIGARPAVLMLGYLRCPNLCDVSEQGMAHALAGTGLRPGTDASVLFVSIDPRDRPADALARQRMLARMPGDANAAHWRVLVGGEAAIRQLAQAVGFHYFYDARIDQYAHPAGLVVATADGRVNQYLMGANYVPQTLRLAVVAASHHTLGTIVDQLVLLCCGYDPATGRYTVTIERIMQGLGIGFVAVLLTMFALLRRHRPGAAP